MLDHKSIAKQFITLCLALGIFAAPCVKASDSNLTHDNERSFLFFGKKKNKNKSAEADTVAAKSDYEKLTDAATVSEGMFNVLKKDKDYYFEIPSSLLGRDMLVVNKLVRVPLELNEAGVNRGINTSNVMIRFELDKENNTIFARQSRVLPDVNEESAIAQSVRDNYISPMIASFKVEAYNADSTAAVVKITDFFNGQKTPFGDIFGDINLGTSANSELSKIKSVKAFENNVYAVSELTTRVVEGTGAVYVTLELGTTILLLPEKPMARRFVSPKVGYFTESTIAYDDNQQRVRKGNYITRWRLEPKPEDEQAYLAGELVEPAKPIVFYIDNSMPRKWRPYIIKGIEDWNSAFEGAGFRNAIKAIQLGDSVDVDMDDINYSTLTYAASTKSNAMGPSITDPRSGEIIEADIIWWHNVLDILHDWIIVQTAAVDPDARTVNLPDHLLGDAMRFVACHEVGHSLGLRHNMMASAAIPTDSLRNPEYIERLGGTSSSIMDYARFNYVAQPGDGVKTLSPHIGPYDRMAIEYGYRWYGKDNVYDDYAELQKFLEGYSAPLYRYCEAQDSRDALDPRGLSEDLGDDAMKSAAYGIANLKRIVPNIIKWSTTGEAGQDYDEASNLFSSVIGQWQRYLYHVMANIGGMYVENTTIGDGQATYTHVEKERQRRALQFIIDECLTHPAWLFDAEVTKYTYLVSNNPMGRVENSPSFTLKNAQGYILWDLLTDNRLVRMYENESTNGNDAFKASDMMDMLHKHIFASTIAGRTPDVRERSLQKNFLDALIISANETRGVKDGSLRIADENAHAFENMLHKDVLECSHCNHLAGERTAARRIINFYGGQVNRISDAISVKRGEMMQIRRLLINRIPSASRDAKYHYEDMLMRINSALGIAQQTR